MANDLPLPHNLEAERAVLGAVLVNNDVYDQAAAIIGTGAFFRVAHQKCWAALATLRAQGLALDLVTLTNELSRRGELEDVGGPAYVAAFIDGTPTATNVAHYAGIVQEKAALRELVQIGHRLRTAALTETATSSSLLDTLDTEIEATRTRLLHGARAGRHLSLLSARDVEVRPVRWLWDQRLALAAFGLLGGREGIGKSILAYSLAADVTRGRLRGAYTGVPRAVVIVATEDSKEHTIVPRLIAADADLSRVFFVTATAADGTPTNPVLPVDLPELARVITDVGAVLVLLDPLLSRLDAALDSHKDAEARRALEPLAKLADETGACFLGLIHVNKTSTSDPLTMLMASRAFAAVARFVLFAMLDPDDEHRRLLGLAKSNLGRTDLPTLAYQIVGQHVADTDEGAVWTGRLEWLGETENTIREAIQSTTATGDKTATTEAAEWLSDYLTAAGGSADSAEIKKAGTKAGHTADHLRRAREKLKLRTLSVGFPRTTRWALRDQSGHQSGQPVPTSPTTATTATTGDFSNELIDCVNPSVVAVGAVVRDPARGATTGATTGKEATREY